MHVALNDFFIHSHTILRETKKIGFVPLTDFRDDGF